MEEKRKERLLRQQQARSEHGREQAGKTQENRPNN